MSGGRGFISPRPEAERGGDEFPAEGPVPPLPAVPEPEEQRSRVSGGCKNPWHR